MLIQIVDNVERKTVEVIEDAIENASDVRLAVAFVTRDGLAQLLPCIHRALARGVFVEFLIGLEPRATDPIAVKELYELSRGSSQASLLCFVSRKSSPLYHPKMYLTKDEINATAIIGSSNLTRQGLWTNIEVNVVIRDSLQSDVMWDVYNSYNRLKYHPERVVPDGEFIDLYLEWCRRERHRERELSRVPELRELKEAFLSKANTLQRPKRTKADLIGWLELVYDALPEGMFTNHEVYEKESEFQQHYPQNLNIKAKIRQQLQVLHKLGFIEHVSRGVWKKVV